MNAPQTDPYKGVRDFYPDDMAVQRYIFDTWSKTAELFGFERYDASVLEPAELYRAKSSEEIVNEQTYTFIDRGDREVTLRPEMTPTVARMVAAKRRDLVFPIRWYSIPNLFRYERTQRGRLREHWQLNCDIFGTKSFSADVEMIALAHAIFKNFGATDNDFSIEVNSRTVMQTWFSSLGITGEAVGTLTRLIDRKDKMEKEAFTSEARAILGEKCDAFCAMLESDTLSDWKEYDADDLLKVIENLEGLGIENVRFNPSLARGFDYYTGTIFEIFDTSPENRRSILGGGRYDNLTGLFGGDPIPAVGFGMGDVTMRDFLEIHNLIPDSVMKRASAKIMVLPQNDALENEAEKIASEIRMQGIPAAVDLSGKKLGEQIERADKRRIPYIIVVGETETASGTYTLKELATGEEKQGSLSEILQSVKVVV